MSEAHKKLTKEVEGKPEWRVFILPDKGGLKIVHFDEMHILVREELKDIMRGYFPREYYMDVLVDAETGDKIYVKHLIDLSRYTWLPKHMYRRFLRVTCEVLGIPYKMEMLDLVSSGRLTPKARVVFPEKSVFEKAEKRTAEIKEREESINREIERMRELMKSLKEEKK